MLPGSDPTLTVSEFVAVFNQSLEIMYPSIGIVGEVANFKIVRGQWVYFDLKDEHSSVKFFGTVNLLPGPLEDGLNLEVLGRPRLHPKFGFSVNVLAIKVIGEGSLVKAQALLAKKLELEGLFGEDRKRTLPYPPSRIGLITSEQSAAYADFIKIINHRWGSVQIELIDSLVQGIEAPPQLVRAIDFFNTTANPPEVLVIVRGGGSADDLAAFSAEQVVRAVASSRIPTMVAIGHEVDMSLAELAADKRASTPSNAAELLVPDKAHEGRLLSDKKRYLAQAARQIVETEKDNLTDIKSNIWHELNKKVAQESARIDLTTSLLKALDPTGPLKRGYVITRDASGKLVRSAKNVKTGDKLGLTLRDGKINTEVL